MASCCAASSATTRIWKSCFIACWRRGMGRPILSTEYSEKPRHLATYLASGGEAVAESMVVHFACADWYHLIPWLDRLAARVELRRWNYPDLSDPLLFVYEYDNIIQEYEPEDQNRLNQLLPRGPSSTICCELRR